VALAASFTGWWFGLGIGFTVVVVVVVLVAMILTYAARIRDQAEDGIARMDMARSNTQPVWGIQDINVLSTGIWRSAEKARKLLEGGS
jgi:ABC-type transport system involved in cytochrome bd biosynthesis fused ATPase/permease subunit